MADLMADSSESEPIESLKNHAYIQMMRSRPRPLGQRPPTPRPARSIVGNQLVFGDGLLGVPKVPFERMIARFLGLKVGTQRVVSSVDAFGSRAGSTFIGSGREGEKVRSGKGPHRNSDIDIVVSILVCFYHDERKRPWITSRLEEAVSDYTSETGMAVDFHTTPSRKDFFSHMDDTNPAIVELIPSSVRQFSARR